MKRIILGLLCGMVFSGWVLAETNPVVVTLTQAEETALAFSPLLKAKRMEAEAAQAKVDMQGSLLWPRLTLEGSWRYVSEVAELSVVPGRPSTPMGDHNNYSIGPMLSWNLWDSGSMYFSRLAAQAAYQAKMSEVHVQEKALKLQVRTAYVQAQLGLEQMRLLFDSLKLVQAQYKDIRSQYNAGSSTKVDSLSSHQDLLATERQLRQARLAWSGTLRDLFLIMGESEGKDVTCLIPADLQNQWPTQMETPTLVITLDTLEPTLQRFLPASQARLNPNPPQVQILAAAAEATRAVAHSLETGHWPKLQLTAKSSLDYPNGPVLETVHQNTFSASGSLSLFEFGRISNQVEEQTHLAEAAELQKQQTQLNLQLLWSKTLDQWNELKQEERLDQQAVAETDELSQLVYRAYKAGRSNYLDVQAANYRALGAKMIAARTHVSMLIQLIVLDSLAENEVK